MLYLVKYNGEVMIGEWIPFFNKFYIEGVDGLVHIPKEDIGEKVEQSV